MQGLRSRTLLLRSLKVVRTLPRRRKVLVAGLWDAASSFLAGVLIAELLANPPLIVASLAAAAAGMAATVAMIAVLGGYSTVVRFMTANTSAIFALSALSGTVAWIWTLTSFTGLSAIGGTFYYLSTFALIFGSRFVLREADRRISDEAPAYVPVAIYGAGTTGRQLAAYLRAEGFLRPVAFLDDNPALFGLTISGLRVYSPRDIISLSGSGRVKEVLLALPAISGKRRVWPIYCVGRLGWRSFDLLRSRTCSAAIL
jgi:FlaA1/EpsC-like NDP-sugar epimerase